MPATTTVSTAPVLAHWRDLVQPREHGSWSLALEPLALGLLVAPSAPGACLAFAALAGFLLRRPFKIALRENSPARRHAAYLACGLLGAAALGTFTLALVSGGTSWLAWLIPPAVAGAIFLVFDLDQRAREQAIELAGAAAFALSAGAIAAAGGKTSAGIAALLFATLGRALPTVMFVRACVRGLKTGAYRTGPSLLAAAIAAIAGLVLMGVGRVPVIVPLALAILFARVLARFVRPPAQLRPRTLGLQEMALGLVYVAALGAAWPR